MKGAGMLVGNFDQSGRGPSFLLPLKETILRRMEIKKI